MSTTPKRSPSLADVIRRAVENAIAELFVFRPGRIESFDPDTQFAVVQPLLKEAHEGEDGAEVVTSLPLLNDVPCVFLGGGGFDASFPVAKGDTCVLLHADRSLDKWKAGGGNVDPVDARRHHIADAIAIVGLRFKGDALDFNGTDLEIGAARGKGLPGTARLQITKSLIKLGLTAGESVIKGDTYRAADATFDNAITTASATAAAASTTAAGTLGPLAANPAPTLADLKTLIGLLNTWVPTVGTYQTALGSAAAAKETGCATCLSTLVKTE